MSRLIQRLDRRFYRHHEPPAQRLRREVLLLLTAESVCLDFGAGRGKHAALGFRGQVRRVAGVDVDRAVLDNPLLDEARMIEGERIPFDDEEFDLVYSLFVLEHLKAPQRTFRELARVLRAGGRLIALTPNRRHYVALAARFTPHRFHEFYNALRGRPPHDTFPTYYRANTAGALRQLADQSGLRVERLIPYEGRPAYLTINPVLYLAGVVYERLVMSTKALAPFRASLTVVMRKPDRAESGGRGSPPGPPPA